MQLHCSNCKQPTHTVKYCIALGGCMAGEMIEKSKQAQCNEKDKFFPPTTGKVEVNINGMDGKAYLAQVNFSQLGSLVPSPFPAPNLLPSDLVPPGPYAYICELETKKYNGWLATSEEFTTSVNWKDMHHKQITLMLTATEVTPLSQTTYTLLNIIWCPFWMDTGTSAHITPFKEDFLSLHPLCSLKVRGFSDASVTAIGLGNVKLCIEHGVSVLLCNVLYIAESLPGSYPCTV